MKIKNLFYITFIFLVCIQIPAFCQDTANTSKLDFGIRLDIHYGSNVDRSGNGNRFIHTIPAFSIEYKRHDFHIGFQCSYVLKPNYIYKKDAYGINFGYRYYSKEFVTKLRIFGQFNFSIYQVKYTIHQLGPPHSTEKKEIIVENTASLGIDFIPFKHIHIYSGVGASFPWFNDAIALNCYVGLEYKF